MSDTRKDIRRRLLQVVFSIAVTALLLFTSAGTLKWPFAWAYLIASTLIIAVNSLIFPPELIAERGKKKENTEIWDKRLTSLMLVPWTGLFIVAGLDHRWGWSADMPGWLSAIGLAAFILGSALVSWAMMSNHYFSTAVRIQYERGHQVATGGPYRFVRHPGYLGMIGYQLFSPLIFSSVWAFIPAGLTALLFVVRTVYEDHTLQERLDGYKEYARQVRWKLFPGVW